MEDVVDALKIAFAALIFVVALAVFYRMISLAKSTSDAVLYSIDKATYYAYSPEENLVENRVVTLKDMIPTIYRYPKEDYGVTIIDKSGTIIARFDVNIEDKVKDRFSNSKFFYNTNGFKDNTEKFILNDFNEILIASKNNPIDSTSDLEKILKNIYGIRDGSDRLSSKITYEILYAIDWSAKDETVLPRLKMDIYGDIKNTTLPDHKAICNGKGLLGIYNYNSTFTEYVLERDGNTYILEDGTVSNYNSSETVVDTRGQTKMEIIYVELKR